MEYQPGWIKANLFLFFIFVILIQHLSSHAAYLLHPHQHYVIAAFNGIFNNTCQKHICCKPENTKQVGVAITL
jgi:hypothetical protein